MLACRVSLLPCNLRLSINLNDSILNVHAVQIMDHQSQLSFSRSKIPAVHSRGTSLDRGALSSRDRPVVSLDIPRESSLIDIYRVHQKTPFRDLSMRSRPIWRSTRDRPTVSFALEPEKEEKEPTRTDLKVLVPGEEDDRIKSPIESPRDDQKFSIGIECLSDRRR
jgi:hypothetical protein